MRRVRRVNRPSRAPLSPPGTAVDTNTWSPQTIGVAEPLPGISIFQRRFCVSLHSTGGSAAGASPVARGPRHCGQPSSAAADACAPNAVSPHTAASAAAAVRQAHPVNFRRCFMSIFPIFDTPPARRRRAAIVDRPAEF